MNLLTFDAKVNVVIGGNTKRVMIAVAARLMTQLLPTLLLYTHTNFYLSFNTAINKKGKSFIIELMRGIMTQLEQKRHFIFESELIQCHAMRKDSPTRKLPRNENVSPAR